MLDVKPSTCRFCSAYCPVDVTLEEGRVVKVEGNRRAPLYGGFICPKGRALPLLHDAPDRLMTSMKRQEDGSYAPIALDQAIDEIVAKLRAIIAAHGPDAVASFTGNPSVEQPATSAVMGALMRAIGSQMAYSMSTLDQPNTLIANALHGTWGGGRMRPETLDVFMIVGGNPVISKQYFGQNPGARLKAMTRRATSLIVIDPRRTETARRAAVHLQPVPGEDPVIVAGLVHLVIGSGGVNAAFVERNAAGLAALTEAVAPFTPAYVAARAGIAEGDLREAARLIAGAGRADFGVGTGTAMATRGTLTSYLLNCLQTLRGHWAGEHEEITYSPVLTAKVAPRAQPRAPVPASFGHRLRTRGLGRSVAGLPAAALAEEILTPGEGQVRALFVNAGLMRTMPDEALTHKALRALDLCVTHDTRMSPTSQVADYVIAARHAFELPALSIASEVNSLFHPGYGYPEPFGSYQPALVEPPAGAEVIETWRLYYRIAQRLGLQLHVGGLGNPDPAPLDMAKEPETEDIFRFMCEGSAIGFDRLLDHPDGKVFDEARVRVGARDPDCGDRLELADPEMLAELAGIASEDPLARRGTDADFPLLFIPRRMQNVTNGMRRLDPARLGTMTNPAFLHPAELASLGLEPGDLVAVRSRHGTIEVVAEADPDLRMGVVAIAHGFGRLPGEASDPRRDGSNVNRLTSVADDFDRHAGMPRMGAIPVSVTKLVEPAPAGSGAA